MSFANLAKDVFILLSIASLLMLGLGITLNSGTVAVAGHQPARGRASRGSLLSTALGLGASVMMLVMVQQLVGFKLTSLW